MAAGVEGRLKVDSFHGRMIEAEADDPADLVLIDAALDGGHKDDGAADFGQAVERAEFCGQDIGLAADDAVGFAFEAVELEIDVRAHFGQFGKKAVVVRDALAVGVQHHVGDAALLCGAHHRNDLRVDRRLAAGELHDLRIALGGDKAIENVFDFFERQIEARTGLGKAERTCHVAGAVDFDDAETGVLLVIGTQAAIVRAAVLDLSGEFKRDGAGLVELRGVGVQLRVAIDQCFERSMIGAALAHVDLVVADQDVGVDDAAALGADAAGQFVEDVVRVFLQIGRCGQRVDRRLGMHLHPL